MICAASPRRCSIVAGAGCCNARRVEGDNLYGDCYPTRATLQGSGKAARWYAERSPEDGGGFIEMTSDWNTPDPATEFAMVRRVMEACGRPLVFSLNQRHDRTEAWKDLLELSTKAFHDGLPIRCVVPPRPIGARRWAACCSALRLPRS